MPMNTSEPALYTWEKTENDQDRQVMPSMGKIPLQIGDKGGNIDKSFTSELEFFLI